MSEIKKALISACKEFEEDLVLYYYGDCLNAERKRVEYHLKECDACYGFLEDLRGFLPGMADAGEYPQTFWDSYLKELQEKLAVQEKRRSWWRVLSGWNRPWAIPAVGTALVLIVASALVFNQGVSTLVQQPSQEVVPPEIIADTGKLDFFKSMDLLESLQVLEAIDGTRSESENIHRL
jgi:predicted anti-sigma-YlaC factor YlaD